MTISPEVLRSIPGQKEVLKNNPIADLTPVQKRALRFAALGLSQEETARRMKIRLSAVKWHRKTIFKAFGVNSMLKAAIIGVEKGVIDIGNVTKNLDIKGIERLSDDERRLLDAMTQNGGENSSYEALAVVLGITDSAFRSHLHTISEKLEMKRITAALLYLAHKRENGPLVTP